MEPVWWAELRQTIGPLDTGDQDEPLMIRLAYLGRALTDDVDALTEQQRADLFALLERVVVHGARNESTSVTTGFFEALLNAWDLGFDLKLVWHHVGPESRAFCLAWNAYNGIASPDWM
ncbi:MULTISPECIES: hypothetical protein [Actinosynnema]|uniref:hypothetical protein n=1 Tax=Actinosynnema TaxID=40566 RepID=UPI0020A39AF2|nr:hypothetical protein [Actinosynnema pretiosum]MCP2097871.1 hypothetical protein [Actinosynnema pretiosum]